MDAVIIFIAWIVLSAVAGTIAKGKGRSAPLYFFMALLFTPLVGIIVAVAVGPNKAVLDRRELDAGRARKCPSCAELVKPEASKCRHCGSELTPIPKPPPGLLAKIFGGR